MRIGIDVRMWGKGYGIGRYIEQLVLHLLALNSSDTFFLFVLSKNKDDIETEIKNHVSVDNVRFIVADINWYSWKEQLLLSKILKKTPVDLMHFPHWNVPFFYNKPFVATIHDLTMFHYARPDATTRGKFVYLLKDKAHRILIKRVVKKAKHLLVTSEFTKQDVHKTLGVEMDKMTVIYQAPFVKDTRHKEQDTKESRKAFGLGASWDDVLGKYGISGWYAMYVGAAYPHKNLKGLLKAWKRFEEMHGDQYQLVLVGKKNDFYDRLLDSEEMLDCKNVVYTGFVEDDVLDVLYSQSSLFVFPSLYEGFGMPPLEAMSRGIPVVSSNRSCMPEVLGEAALYVDPENSEQFSDAIYRGFSDEDVRVELKVNGRKNLKRYSWGRLAEETLEVYRKSS